MAHTPWYFSIDWTERKVAISRWYIPVLVFKALKDNDVRLWQWVCYPYLCLYVILNWGGSK